MTSENPDIIAMAKKQPERGNEPDVSPEARALIDDCLKQMHAINDENILDDPELTDEEKQALLKGGLKKINEYKISRILALRAELEEKLGEMEGEGEGKTISETTPEGKEVTFELGEVLAHWKKFYEDNKVDWITLPDRISVTEEQREEMKRLIRELGFDAMLIIPENLADTGERYEKLHTAMSVGYKETFQSDNFKQDGGFGGIKNSSNGLRIILTKEAQNLNDDEFFAKTIGKSVDDLEAEKGLFAILKVRGIDPATYLVCQREYFKQTGKHLDEKGWTWFTEVIRPRSGRVPDGGWNPDDDHLGFGSIAPGSRNVNLGCRLSGSFDVT